MAKESFDVIWNKIVENQGKPFHYKRKKDTFTYHLEGDKFISDAADSVPAGSDKENIKHAYDQWPVKGPGEFDKNTFATSYVWGVLNELLKEI